MSRQALLTSVVSGVLLPVAVGALGLGELSSQAALNEPFTAEVALLGVKPDELDTVKVALASPQAYEKAGIDRPQHLSRLRFKPQVMPDGRVVIRVSSADPIREPYLDFLIEVNWPHGRAVKAYTVLLDPPVTLARRPPPLEPPQAATATRARVQPPPVQARDQAGPRPSPAPQYPLEYGPVRPNQTLWSIARSLRIPGTTVEQRLMALFNNNPDAFLDRDINMLKEGQVLSIPSRDAVFELTPPQAERAFDAELTQSPHLPPVKPDAQPTAPQVHGDRLKIATGYARDAAPASQPAGPDRAGTKVEALHNDLLLVREENESARQEMGDLRERIRDLEQQLVDIGRLLKLRNEQLAELRSGGGRSEAATDATQGERRPEALGAEARNPAVHDAGSVAALQTLTLPGGGVGPEAEELLAHPKSGEAGPADAEPFPRVETTISATAEELDPSAADESLVMAYLRSIEDEAEPPNLLDAAPGALHERLEHGLALRPAAPRVQQAGAPAPPPTARSTAVAEGLAVADGVAQPRAEKAAEAPAPSFLGSVFGRVFSWSLLGAALVGSVLFGSWWRRRQREQMPEAAPVRPAAAMRVDEPAGAERQPQSARAPRETAGQERLSDAPTAPGAPERFDAAAASAEVDVYLAYGRYQAAEALVKQQLDQEPQRLDLQLKLAEVYQAQRNGAAFGALMHRLEAADVPSSNPDEWARLRALAAGLDLGAERASFGAAASEATECSAEPVSQLLATESQEAADRGGDLEFAPDRGSMQPRQGPEERRRASDSEPERPEVLPDLEFDLESPDEAIDPEVADAEAAAEDDTGLAAELAPLELEHPEPEVLPEPSGEAPAEVAAADGDRDTRHATDLQPAEVQRQDPPPAERLAEASLPPLEPADEEQTHAPAAVTVQTESEEVAPHEPGEGPGTREGLENAAVPAPVSRAVMQEVPGELERELKQLAAADPGHLQSWDDSDNLQTLAPDGEDSAAHVAAELLDLDVSDLELAESDAYPGFGSLPDQPAAAGESLPAMDGLDAWDDMATKIDLAKAYLELDDSEEARGLLAAVIEDGTEQQREEAQQILSKIA